MSGELDIRGGGAIAVDTDTLRAAATGFVALAGELADLARLVGSAQATLFTEREGWDAATAAFTLYRRLTTTEDATTAVADRLQAAAALYEMAELNAAHAAAVFAGDADAAARLDARRAELAAIYPTAVWDAWGAQFEHNLMWPGELVRQGTETWEPFGPEAGVIGGALPYALLRTAAAIGKGRVANDSRLGGAAADVRVWPVAASGSLSSAGVAPTSLADAAARIPSAGSGEARVRVEKYTMADGARQFAVYVAGTKLTADASEPFNVVSAVELEAGSRSASYDATLAALRDAGAEPGDVVHAFGHSQGAAVVGHLALEGGYDTRTVVSLGSPIEVDVGSETLSISLRHTDDPLAMLTAGGHDHAVGAPGSFVAQRAADPVAGLHDLGMPAHDAAAYIQTAGMLDASPDPRMDAARALLDELGSAASVDVTEYGAARR